jgi:hypothetical protein
VFKFPKQPYDAEDGAPPDEPFKQFMARHLVSFHGVAERLSNGMVIKKGPFSFSGFVLRLGDLHFWVTAGHCLELLDKQIRAGDLRVVDSAFADSHGAGASNEYGVPFTYEPGCGVYVHDGTDSLDFGVVPLNNNLVRLMHSNGVVSISRENWIHQHNLEFERYMMLGIPECLKSDETEAGVSFRPVMLRLNRITNSQVPDVLGQDWLVFQLAASPQVIPSIQGMSGGGRFTDFA